MPLRKEKCPYCSGSGKQLKDVVDRVWDEINKRWTNVRVSETESCGFCGGSGRVKLRF